MRPVYMTWDGECFKPANSYQAERADEEFVIGERVPIAVVEQASDNSRRHYFACLREGWNSLPEKYALEPWAQSVEALRKYALIRTGFCSCVQTACGSKEAAQRVALLAHTLDEYSISRIVGETVQTFRADSQSSRAMGKDRFQASKTAVLDFVADLIGVTAEDLAKQREAA